MNDWFTANGPLIFGMFVIPFMGVYTIFIVIFGICYISDSIKSKFAHDNDNVVLVNHTNVIPFNRKNSNEQG